MGAVDGHDVFGHGIAIKNSNGKPNFCASAVEKGRFSEFEAGRELSNRIQMVARRRKLAGRQAGEPCRILYDHSSRRPGAVAPSSAPKSVARKMASASHPAHPMKITFVCAPFNMTGGNRVIAIYARYLQSFGHEVLLVAPPHAQTHGFLPRLLRKLGLPPLTRRPPIASHMDGIGIPTKILNRHRSVRASDVPNADVIVATWWQTAEFVMPMPIAKGRKVYFVQHHEAFDWMPRDRVASTYSSPMQKVVVAEWLVKAIEEDGNRVGARIVPNAVDRALFFAPPRTKRQRPRLGTLFSETAFKGFNVTLDVIARVRAAVPELEVVAFGELAPSKYKDRVDNIQLIVQPQQETLREIYAGCDVWLCCSISEGFNLMAMEAMACRTPVVSTRTGWPAEAIVDGVNGALAEANDAEGLAAAVLSILRASDAEWTALSEGAARTVADSSWERSARLFEAALIDGKDQ